MRIRCIIYFHQTSILNNAFPLTWWHVPFRKYLQNITATDQHHTRVINVIKARSFRAISGFFNHPFSHVVLDISVLIPPIDHLREYYIRSMNNEANCEIICTTFFRPLICSQIVREHCVASIRGSVVCLECVFFIPTC